MRCETVCCEVGSCGTLGKLCNLPFHWKFKRIDKWQSVAAHTFVDTPV